MWIVLKQNAIEIKAEPHLVKRQGVLAQSFSSMSADDDVLRNRRLQCHEIHTRSVTAHASLPPP